MFKDYLLKLTTALNEWYLQPVLVFTVTAASLLSARFATFFTGFQQNQRGSQQEVANGSFFFCFQCTLIWHSFMIYLSRFYHIEVLSVPFPLYATGRFSLAYRNQVETHFYRQLFLFTFNNIHFTE